MDKTILLRGGGDLASGVALRLHRAGFGVLITEVPDPLSVRRLVSFSEAVFEGEFEVEGIRGILIDRHRKDIKTAVSDRIDAGDIPVLTDPDIEIIERYPVDAVVDGRMRKIPPARPWASNLLTIGLGPGFVPGVNCHAAVETKRGHTLGRVYWEGGPAEDTGEPDAVMGITYDRVIRAPATGVLEVTHSIGSRVHTGDILGSVGGMEIQAKFDGILRGMLRHGAEVDVGLKIGDLDPRGVWEYCVTVSDKALAVGGGVLEALLTPTTRY